jgi:drug/metabolite transporter (DMT)-like permease
VIFDVVVLAASVLAYGSATLLLADGSTGGIVRALQHRAWLAGMVLQAAGFLLAFLARRDLPLLVVQPATTASVAVTCLLGAALGRWRLSPRDQLGLAAVVLGIAGAGASAASGPAVLPGPLPLLAMLAVLGWCAVGAVRSVRRPVPVGRSALVVGAAAGVAFGVSAVGARALAADPLTAVRSVDGAMALLLLGIGTVLGQVLLTAAISGGAVAGPSSSMHIVETVGPALVGVAFLGDVVVQGRGTVAAGCVLVALVGCLVLTDHGAPAAQ